MSTSPLVVRPRPFSGYGLYEIFLSITTGAVAALFLLSFVGSFASFDAADRRDFWRAFGIVALWGVAFGYAFTSFAKDISQDFARGIGLMSLMLLAGAGALVLANTRGYVTEQGTVYAAATIVFFLMLARAIVQLADVFGTRSVVLENGVLTIRSLFGHTSVIDMRDRKVVRLRYQLQAPELGIKIRHWGQTCLVYEQAGGVFLEENIARGWARADLDAFVNEANARLASAIA